MITGDKVLPPGTPVPMSRPARPGPAVAAVAAIIGVVGLALAVLDRLPPTGVRPLVQNLAYAEECGTCHDDFHPSLLPTASWAALISGLEDHFGDLVSFAGGVDWCVKLP
jgi:hypothetical protein